MAFCDEMTELVNKEKAVIVVYFNLTKIFDAVYLRQPY